MDVSTSPAPFALDAGVVLLLIAVVLLLVAGAWLIRIQLRARRSRHNELPPLVYPVPRGRRRAPGVAASNGARPPSVEHVTFNSAAPAPAVRIHRESAPHANGGHPVAGKPGAADARLESVVAPDSDMTLQLLPGRLEPVDADTDQEIRFVKVPGNNRFTLGRDPGPARNHIQLRAATASRMHAFMAFEDGRWRLGNLSRTNCVVVNGSPLTGDAAWLLKDGDRIELGELTFVFRDR